MRTICRRLRAALNGLLAEPKVAAGPNGLACLVHLGRLDEARREVNAGLAVDPKFTIARFRAGAQSDNAVYLAQRERIIEGMRLAGVSEG